MPRISSSYGIVIAMYHDESHRGRPHFHAIYGDDEGSFDIETLELIVGSLHPRPQAGARVGHKASRRVA